jgi:hypothetical protein
MTTAARIQTDDLAGKPLPAAIDHDTITTVVPTLDA